LLIKRRPGECIPGSVRLKDYAAPWKLLTLQDWGQSSL
jgi:hypothetical protein